MAKRDEEYREAVENIATRKAGSTSKAVDQVEIPATGRTLPTSVGLKESEIDILDKISAELSIHRNQLMRYALRWFMKSYMAGAVDLFGKLEEKPAVERTNKLKMD